MAEMMERAKDKARRLRNRVRGGGGQSPPIHNLRARVAELEAEVLENRQLARRIAELTDVVELLLLPEDIRDTKLLEQRLKQVRARH